MNTFLVCKGLGGRWVTFHTWWRKQSNIKGWVIFGHFWLEGGIQGGIILEDNSAGHCFVLKDFVATNNSWLCDWNCALQAKVLVKLVLKAIRNTFSPICGLWWGEWQRDSIFLVGVISSRRAKFKILGLQGEPPPSPSLSSKSWSPHKETPEEGTCSPYSNAFEKSE